MLGAMSMLSRFNPVGGVSDFWNEFRKPQPYRVPILLVSAAIPLFGLYLLTGERYMIPLERPDVTFITSYAPGRSDAEILASNIANQERKEAAAAYRAQLEEQARDGYRALGRATGLDVDEMEREARAEQQREEAAAEARRRRMLEAAGLEAAE